MGCRLLTIIRAIQALTVAAIGECNKVVVLQSLEANNTVRVVGDINHIRVLDAFRCQKAIVVPGVDTDVAVVVGHKVRARVSPNCE